MTSFWYGCCIDESREVNRRTSRAMRGAGRSRTIQARRIKMSFKNTLTALTTAVCLATMGQAASADPYLAGPIPADIGFGGNAAWNDYGYVQPVSSHGVYAPVCNRRDGRCYTTPVSNCRNGRCYRTYRPSPVSNRACPNGRCPATRYRPAVRYINTPRTPAAVPGSYVAPARQPLPAGPRRGYGRYPNPRTAPGAQPGMINPVGPGPRGASPFYP